jgi:hypothetical protein
MVFDLLINLLMSRHLIMTWLEPHLADTGGEGASEMACTAHDTMHKQVNKMSYALFQGSGVHEHDLPGRAFEQRQLFASSFVRCCSLFRTTKCRTTKTQLKTAVITINRTNRWHRQFPSVFIHLTTSPFGLHVYHLH